MAKLLNFSEAATIAIHSMIFIVRSNQKVNINQISETIGASRHHVAKVMQQLVQAKFLKSGRGPSGGFVLLKNADKISLYDVYRCIEGDIEDTVCSINNKACPPYKCTIGLYGGAALKDLKARMIADTLNNYLPENDHLKEKQANA